MKYKIFLLKGLKSVYVADSTENAPEDSTEIGEFKHEGPLRNFPVFAAVRDALHSKQIFDASYYNIFTKDSLPSKKPVLSDSNEETDSKTENDDPESTDSKEDELLGSDVNKTGVQSYIDAQE